MVLGVPIFKHFRVTHAYLGARNRVIGKQCRPRSDAEVGSDPVSSVCLQDFSSKKATKMNVDQLLSNYAS